MRGMSEPSARTSVTADVRMRGFTQRTAVEEVFRWLDGHVSALEPEYVALNQAAGRILAEDVASPLDVPSFDRAMMDWQRRNNRAT